MNRGLSALILLAACEDLEGEIGEPAPDLSGATTTCSDVGTVSWSLVEEWSYEKPGFVMNPVVAPQPGDSHASVFLDQGVSLLVLDGRDGSEILESDAGYLEDDGSTPVVGDADGVAGLEVVATSWQVVHVLDVDADSWTSFPMDGASGDEAVQLVDIDLDGAAEIAQPAAVYDLSGAVLASGADGAESTGFFAADLDQDGLAELVNGAGVWEPATGDAFAWDAAVDPDYALYGGPVQDGGDTKLWFSTGNLEVHLAALDGTLEWSAAAGGGRSLAAIGDATGDGAPELCSTDHEDLVLVDLDGNEVQRWNEGSYGYLSGACSMADLDADGVYEVLAVGYAGFFIYDGRTGATLASDTSLSTLIRDTAPIVADLDGDGSAEILVNVDDRLVALGPASGRWARTRPVWNAMAYDATTIRDDGTIISWPAPSWEAYNAFRAQPAHDGLKPDLELEVTATPETLDGVDQAKLSYTVRNRGSAESPALATLTLQTFDGATITEQTLTPIAAAIPAGYAVEGSLLVPLADLGTRWALTVTGEDDCDRVNDRIDGSAP